jgi:hypothetical protein
MNLGDWDSMERQPIRVRLDRAHPSVTTKQCPQMTTSLLLIRDGAPSQPRYPKASYV